MLHHLFWWVPFGRVPEISSKDLYGKLNDNPDLCLIDVRSSREWQASRIEGSLNIPVTSLRQEIKKRTIPSERPIVIICLSAHRSIPAVRLLRAEGFGEVCQLKGGMRAWWEAGLPVAENT